MYTRASSVVETMPLALPHQVVSRTTAKKRYENWRNMTKEEEEARMPDLFMNAEIPDGSLRVPKHQRDCVSPAKVFHYRVEWVPLSLFHPPELPSSTSPSYVVLGRAPRIHATGYRHAN